MSSLTGLAGLCDAAFGSDCRTPSFKRRNYFFFFLAFFFFAVLAFFAFFAILPSKQ